MSTWRNVIHIIRQALRGEATDYTAGNINKAIILLAIPMILELSLESVFAVVDMFFVGKLGPEAIATVGLTEAVVTLIYSAAIGLSTAATAMVARRIGEKNKEGAARAGAQSLIISLWVTIIVSTLGVIFAPQILRLMGAQPEVIKHGAVFSRIMLGGSVVIILLFLINGIFRGAGDAGHGYAQFMDRKRIKHHSMSCIDLRYRFLVWVWFAGSCYCYYDWPGSRVCFINVIIYSMAGALSI
jgi:Na+-driven multidrug efflux pump